MIFGFTPEDIYYEFKIIYDKISRKLGHQEMEKDAIEAHGMGQFTKERMMETSDIANFKVCDDCGMLATRVIDKEYYVCNPCNNHTRISSVNMPYAAKLLFQELMSINIMPKIKTENDKYD